MRVLGIPFLAVFAVAAAANEIPVPREKPELRREISMATIPLPRPKPDITISLEEDAAPEQGKKDKPFRNLIDKLNDIESKNRPASRWPKADIAAGKAACAELLSGLDIIWRPDTPIGEPGGCGTAMPIAVSEIAGVRVHPVATLNCAMAASLHEWFETSLKPSAKKSMGARLIEVTNASSYACRRRNNSKSGKLSEHAKANALDISEFRFAKGGKITVAGDYSGLLQSVGVSGRGNFLRAARKGACAGFNTVLGPGSDPYHKDHFHVDLMPLRPGRYKMCR